MLLARPKDLLSLSGPAKARSRGAERRSGFGDVARAGDGAWDLAIQQVIPHVDGVRDAKMVARASRVDVDVVSRALRVLRHYRCLAVVDTFAYANVYRATARLGALAARPDALDACARFALRGFGSMAEAAAAFPGPVPRHGRPEHDGGDEVVVGGGGSAKGRRREGSSSSRVPEPTSTQILRLYCAFADGRAVRDVLLEANGTAPHFVDALDHRAFVAFAVIHGVLRRVHRFPTALKAPDASHRSRRRPPQPTEDAQLVDAAVALMDGRRCMDEVCSDLDVPAARLDAVLARRGVRTVDVFK